MEGKGAKGGGGRGARLEAIFHPLVAVFAALVVFSPLLGAGLVWDDREVQELQLPHFRTLGDAFFFPSFGEAVQHVYYRPLVWLTYMAERALAPAGRVAAFSHGMNLLYHALAVMLLYCFVRELLRGREGKSLAAGVAALIFACNPAHIESVASIAGRTDILAGIFLLLALIPVARWSGKENPPLAVTFGYALFSGCAIFLALLSKEVAAAGLLLLPATSGYFALAGQRRTTARDYAILCAPALASFLVYLLLRNAAATASAQFLPLAFAEYPLRLVAATGFYLRKAFVPWPGLLVSSEIPPVWEGALALGAGFLLFACGVWKSPRARAIILFCAAWFFATLAPSLGTLFALETWNPVAERYLYLPSAAAAILLGYLAATLAAGEKTRKPALAAALALAVAFGATAFFRTGDWKSDRTFWQAATQSASGGKASRVWDNLGVVAQKEGNDAEAEGHFRKAVAFARTLEEKTDTMYNLATTLIRQTQNAQPDAVVAFTDEARLLLTQVIAADGNRGAPAALALALARKAEARAAKTGSVDFTLLAETRRYAQMGLRIDPGDRVAKSALGIAERLERSAR